MALGEKTSAARAAGLAGAVTAVPDDASAVESNPAALTTLTKSELVGNLLNQGAGETIWGTRFGRGPASGSSDSEAG